MQRRISDYIGTPIVDFTDGKIFGFMKDCVSLNGKIKGVVVQRRTVLSKDCFLPFDSIKEFLIDSIKADCSGYDVITWRNNKDYRYLYNAEIGVIGENGENKGKVSDICFNTDDGALTKLELNKGIRNDLKYGRSMIDNFNIIVNDKGDYEAISKEEGG